jgi:hypothetical protein
MLDLKLLVNITSRKKYASMIRQSFLDMYKEKFLEVKHNDLIILYINSLKKNLNNIIQTHLGEIGGSIDAEAYKVCIKVNDINLYCALKTIPLTSSEKSKIMDLDYKSWKELYILKMIYTLIKNHNCPNIPIIYLYFICKKCYVDDYLNPNIIKYYNNLSIRKKIKDNIDINDKNNNKFILHKMCKKKGFGTSSLCILNELCDNSLKDIINDTYIENIDDSMFYSFIFQIISSVYSIHKFLNICHFDLHGGNFLISNIKANGYWLYTINNQSFYIPNHGYILKIWDFGRSMILNIDRFSEIVNQIIHQCKRFYKEAFQQNTKLENKIIDKLNPTNIKIILLAFDIWRIISYLFCKFKKEEYYLVKFKKTIKLLSSIKKDCEKNWALLLLTNKEINNSCDTFINYILNKYFSKYKNIQKNLINKKTYSI